MVSSAAATVLERYIYAEIMVVQPGKNWVHKV
jgi:hypothetical protein